MAKLRKYTLSKDKEKGDWVLKEDGSKRATRRFPTKAAATAGGVIEKILGPKGGSVKIRKEDGTYQEERTYPRGRDPKGSKG